jgi:hypothetical protein
LGFELYYLVNEEKSAVKTGNSDAKMLRFTNEKISG